MARLEARLLPRLQRLEEAQGIEAPESNELVELHSIKVAEAKELKVDMKLPPVPEVSPKPCSFPQGPEQQEG